MYIKFHGTDKFAAFDFVHSGESELVRYLPEHPYYFDLPQWARELIARNQATEITYGEAVRLAREGRGKCVIRVFSDHTQTAVTIPPVPNDDTVANLIAAMADPSVQAAFKAIMGGGPMPNFIDLSRMARPPLLTAK